MRRIGTGCLLALLIPYIITLVWTGTIRGEAKQPEMISGKKIRLDRDQTSYMDVEEYLIGVVGKQIPADYGQEALKAQAIIARTYIYKQMGGESEIMESTLDMDYLEEKQLEALWGSEGFVESYEQIQEAVEATQGTVITWEGELIDALFHRASAGQTRNADENHPYLQSVESLRDVEAENYLSVTSWSAEDFAARISGVKEGVQVLPEQVPEAIQLIEKEEGGYVKQIQIGNHTFTGEEIQAALGLSSSCFSLEGYEGQIRAVCKGIGHGYGMSQYGARVKAQDGMMAEEILGYYYKNVVVAKGK